MSADALREAAQALRATARALDRAAEEAEGPPGAGRYLSVPSVASMLDTTPARIHKLTSAGLLPIAVRDGRRPLYRIEDVNDYLKGDA